MRNKVHHCIDMNMTLEDFKIGAETFQKLLLDPEICKYKSAKDAHAEIGKVEFIQCIYY